MPSAPTQQGGRSRPAELMPTEEILHRLGSTDIHTIVTGLEAIPRDLAGVDRDYVLAALYEAAGHKETSVRAAVARVLGFLTWPELTLTVLNLLHDRQWVVRANSAKALLKYPNFEALLESALMEHDPLVREVLVRSVEQNRIKQEALLPRLSDLNLAATRTALVNDSSLIREMYLREVGMTWDEFLETELQAA